MEHLNEIRGLRQRLEKSIENNDILQEKLEAKLRYHASARKYPPQLHAYKLPFNHTIGVVGRFTEF